MTFSLKKKKMMILQNDYMLSTRRALAFHWWILDLQAIGPFFSHVILIIFRSGVFQTVYRDTKLRLNERTARWMTTFQSSELPRIPSLPKKKTLEQITCSKLRLILFIIIEREHDIYIIYMYQMKMTVLKNFSAFAKQSIRQVDSCSGFNCNSGGGNHCLPFWL